MSAFTSFVAVEDRVVNPNGNPTTVQVPVEAPEGTSKNGKFPKTYGKWSDKDVAYVVTGQSNSLGNGGGIGSGRGTGNGSASAGNPQQVAGAGLTPGIAQSVNVVEVTSSPVAINTSDSSVSTVIRPDSNGNLMRSGGGGGSSKVTKPKAAKGRGSSSGSGTGSGSGNGVGYGSGNGTGDGDGPEAVRAFNVSRSDTPVLQSPPLSAGAPKMISGGVLNGKATSLPRPAYPAGAMAVNASGAVSIQITIDESGNVIAANAVSGHPLLRAAAEKAARAAQFSPTMMSGKPVKISGVITYNFRTSDTSGNSGNFAGPTNSDIAIEKMKVGPLTPEEKRRSAIAEKLQFWLYAVVARLEKGDTKPAVNEAMFVREGKADIRIELTARSPEVIDKLKACGFELISEKGKTIVIGRIALEKLASLVDIAEVKLVLPMI